MMNKEKQQNTTISRVFFSLAVVLALLSNDARGGILPSDPLSGFLDFIVPNAHPDVAEYLKEKMWMGIFPFYDFDQDEYKDAPVYDPDTRMSEACFKGVPEQNPAATDFREETTLDDNINEIIGVQPSECMPHKTTLAFSPLQLSEWYLISLMDPDNDEEPYQGPAYRGAKNPIMNRQRMVHPTETMQMGCAQDLMVSNLGGETDPYNPAWMRRQLDNCLNQYILQHSRFIRNPDSPAGSNFGVNTGLCQPLHLREPPTRHELYEYVPSDYIGAAWKKLLVDQTYLFRDGRAATEPNYGVHSRVEVTDSIPMPEDNFGLILVEDLREEDPVDLHFEKILDPSHPYTPRWDFETTDRSYSPGTAAYDNHADDSVRCSGEVPVDLLHFRKHFFERWVPQKIAFNDYCYNDKSWPFGCYWTVWIPLNCGDNNNNGCCSTRYDKDDKFPPLVSNAICGPSMQDVCNYVGRPLTGVNTLKMRPGDEDHFPHGVPEGYAFAGYFGNHKPYMRCWDTNTECGEDSQTFEVNGYDFAYNPESTAGSEYAIMGAGRKGENCAIGGGLGMEGVANPDPITSWSELKLYYVRTMRQGANCIGNHEKIFKAYTGENILLSFTGVEWQERVEDTQGNLRRYETRRWPMAWRGYVHDPDPSLRFPNFAGGGPIRTGLDNAVKGEVLIYDQEVAPRRNPYVAYVRNVVNDRLRDATAARNPEIAQTLNPNKDYVQVTAFNHGKYVDACGNTDRLGMGADYTMYKSELPTYNNNLLEQFDTVTKECEDPRLSACIEPLWGQVKRMYVSEHNKN